MRTRIAPTPSGYLHLGNAANALVTAWWATEQGGSLHLRIDDLDTDRVRPAYIDDILDLLTWLEIEWVGGPRSAEDCMRDRADRVAMARDSLNAARAAGLPVYACRCSRRELRGVPTGGCPGECRSHELDLVPHQTALRLAVEPGTIMRVDNVDVDLAAALGDFVVWRRDDLPAYQWASVLEDDRRGITHILRGKDLVESTAAQAHLADLLDLPHATHLDVRHHDLVLDGSGSKLSKSQMGSSPGLPRTPETRQQIIQTAADLADDVGIVRP